MGRLSIYQSLILLALPLRSTFTDLLEYRNARNGEREKTIPISRQTFLERLAKIWGQTGPISHRRSVCSLSLSISPLVKPWAFLHSLEKTESLLFSLRAQTESPLSSWQNYRLTQPRDWLFQKSTRGEEEKKENGEDGGGKSRLSKAVLGLPTPSSLLSPVFVRKG